MSPYFAPTSLSTSASQNNCINTHLPSFLHHCLRLVSPSAIHIRFKPSLNLLYFSFQPHIPPLNILRVQPLSPHSVLLSFSCRITGVAAGQRAWPQWAGLPPKADERGAVLAAADRGIGPPV